MPPWNLALESAASGLAAGVLSGLFGIGGGIVLVPLLALFLGLGQHQAQGLSLAAMLFPNGLPAVLHYRRQGIVLHFRLVGAMVVGFLGGVLVGAQGASLLSPHALRRVFALFLMAVAIRMWRQAQRGPASQHEATAHPWLVPGLVIGLAGGVASGLLGIGGGVVMVPLMVGWMKLTQHEAQLASLALLLPPLGLPGVLLYARTQPNLPWMLVAFIALGFALGALVGARFATRLRGPRLTRGFAMLLVLVGVYFLFRTT